MTATLIGELGCKNCRHAFRNPNGQTECRFNPPIAFPIPTPQGLAGGSLFPPVQPDWKCGKHERGVVVGG